MENDLSYRLIRSGRRSICMMVHEGKLIVRAPIKMSIGEIESFIVKHKKWIEKHLTRAQEHRLMTDATPKLKPEEKRELLSFAKREIPLRVAHYAPLVGVTYGKITIRLQRSLWGSCSSKGNLSFNGLLMLAPSEVLDSIVVHELCHRKQMNHSKRFYDEVLRVFPNYFACKKWLKENGPFLFAKIR